MKTLPYSLPDYTITAISEAPFAVKFEELTNWFIIPKVGEKIRWGTYDLPSRKLNETSDSEVVGKIVLHGIEGVEIVNTFTEYDCETVKSVSKPHTYYAQLTDTHSRWLGESYYDKNGIKQLLTFLDGGDFKDQWELSEDNRGIETNLHPKGDIIRQGDRITAADKKYLFDVVGRYDVTIGGITYETVLAMMVFTDGAMSETYIDRNGRTVLWRRFNRDDWSYSGHSGKWSESHPENERVTVNGDIFVHWYDCISDYIL